jgi:hypothetical protein
MQNLINEIDNLLSNKNRKEELKHNALKITTKVTNISENLIKEIYEFVKNRF